MGKEYGPTGPVSTDFCKPHRNGSMTKLVKGGGFPFKLNKKLVAIKVNKVDVSQGGVILPDNMKDKTGIETPSAVVVGVGPECEFLAVGDTVYIPGATPAMKAKIQDHEFLVLEEDKIPLALVEG